MLIIKLTDSKESIEDVERICRHLTEHKTIINLLSQEQAKDITYILKPTFARNHNIDEKMAHWQKLLQEFTMTDHKGKELRFYRDKQTQALYFGTKDGFDTIESLPEH
ncbi:hypothetical protein [Psychrobacter sanguinis]|uniref:Uncharacterized protein n=1 Tax=Psychrobacter sanguinis TaxID=861445 RepID=A0A844M437_9GAMM|nr:hypothetical protein [Psychrobacter sanguinis]MUG33388.1 hypothetical protein [Psychrobacter sanguinis]